MFIIATEPNLSIFILALSHVLSLRIAEKLRLHSAKVIGNVHAIFNSTNKLENPFSSHFVIAFANVSGQSLEATTNHLRCQSKVLNLSNLLHTLAKLGKCQHFL